MYWCFLRFIYFVAVLDLHCCSRPFSSCGEWGHSQHRSAQAFPAAAAPVAARRLQQLQLPGSRARAQQLGHMGFSCAVACGILAGQGLNPRPLHWQMESHPLYHRGSPVLFCFVYFLQRARPYLFGS